MQGANDDYAWDPAKTRSMLYQEQVEGAKDDFKNRAGIILFCVLPPYPSMQYFLRQFANHKFYLLGHLAPTGEWLLQNEA